MPPRSTTGPDQAFDSITLPQFERLLGHAIAVHDLGEAVTSYERIGLTVTDRRIRTDRGVASAVLPFADGGYLEVMSVIDQERPEGRDVARFLARGGEGLYRTDITVRHLEAVHVSARHTQGHGVTSEEGAGHDLVGLGELHERDGAIRCELEFADPASVGGARFDLVDAASVDDSPHGDTWRMRIFTHAVAVASIDHAVATFVSMGQPLWDRSGRDEWGLDSAVFRQTSDSNLAHLYTTNGAWLPPVTTMT